MKNTTTAFYIIYAEEIGFLRFIHDKISENGDFNSEIHRNIFYLFCELADNIHSDDTSNYRERKIYSKLLSEIFKSHLILINFYELKFRRLMKQIAFDTLTFDIESQFERQLLNIITAHNIRTNHSKVFPREFASIKEELFKEQQEMHITISLLESRIPRINQAVKKKSKKNIRIAVSTIASIIIASIGLYYQIQTPSGINVNPAHEDSRRKLEIEKATQETKKRNKFKIPPPNTPKNNSDTTMLFSDKNKRLIANIIKNRFRLSSPFYQNNTLDTNFLCNNFTWFVGEKGLIKLKVNPNSYRTKTDFSISPKYEKGYELVENRNIKMHC